MHPHSLLLIITIIFLLNTTTTTHPPPSSHPSAQPPSPAFLVYFSETPPPSHKLNNTGDVAGWANILSSNDPSTLPVTATLIIPTNDATAKTAKSTGMVLPDTFFIPYHIVPQHLTFADLRKYQISTKSPTLLHGPMISHRDLYFSGSFSVRGGMHVLDYEVYGNGVLMENGTLETANEEKGDDTVVVRVGSNFWISVAAMLGCALWNLSILYFLV